MYCKVAILCIAQECRDPWFICDPMDYMLQGNEPNKQFYIVIV